MNDQGKTKEQVINELKELREELALFKALSAENIQIVSVMRDFKEIYENFYKSNPHPMWIYDLKTLAFLDINDAAVKHYGYSQEEFLSMTIKDILPTEDIPVLLKNTTTDTKGLETTGIWRHIKKDGTLIYVEIISHTMTFSGRRAEIILALDITEQKHTEEEIKNTLSLLKATLESTADGILVVDRQGKIVIFNQKFVEMWHIPQQIVASHSDDQALSFVLHQLKDPEGFLKKVKELYANPEADSYDELAFKDGRVFERYSHPQRIGESLIGRVWSFRDVTEPKRAAEEIIEKERFMTSIFESIQDGISILDNNLRITRVNNVMEKWYQHTMPLVGQTCYQAYHERHEPCEVCPTQQTLETAEAAYEVVPKRGPKGNIVGWFDLFTYPLFDVRTGKMQGVIEYVRDITERKKAEEALQRSEKELKKRVKELEEFYDMAVGRELRMKQLKKENEELKKALIKYKNA